MDGIAYDVDDAAGGVVDGMAHYICTLTTEELCNPSDSIDFESSQAAVAVEVVTGTGVVSSDHVQAVAPAVEGG